MMHSSTMAGSMPARRTASRTAMAPSWGAVNSFRDPRNLPVGVRTAETTTDSRIDVHAFDGVGAEQALDPQQDGLARSFELARPLHVPCGHDEIAVPDLDGRHARQRRPDRHRPRE